MFVRILTTLLILINFKLIESWNFNAIREIVNSLDCIHIYFRNLEEGNTFYETPYTTFDIPLENTNDVDLLPMTNSKCRHKMLEVKDMQEFTTVFENRASRAGFLFILFSTEPNWPDILTTAEHYWLSQRIHKVFYISQGLTRFYHPFMKDNYGKYGALVDAEEYDINKIFHNMNGYPMRIYIFDSVFSNVMANGDTEQVTGVQGTDGKVAYLLEEYLNYKIEFQWPDDDFFGARLDDGTFNGAIGRMVRNETDICLTGFFIKDYLARGMDFSTSVYMDKLCCYVIKAKRIPSSILPLYAVHESIWMVYVIVGTLSSFFWMLLRRANLRLNCEELIEVKNMRFQWYDIFTDTWVLWVRMIILRFPPSNAERIFAISLCLVSVIIGAIVDSSLATVYIEPLYYKDITTLAELDKANLRIFYKHAAIKDDLFTGHSSPIYQRLDKDMMLVGEPEERLISIMAKRGGFVAVTRASSLDLVDIYYFITKKVFMIPECPKLYHIAFPLVKHSPYEEVINVALMKFLSAGLLNHWIDGEIYKARSRIHLFREYVAESDNKWKVLNIIDLQLAFYVLVIGIILSALVFIGECFYNSYKLRKKRLERIQ